MSLVSDREKERAFKQVLIRPFLVIIWIPLAGIANECERQMANKERKKNNKKEGKKDKEREREINDGDCENSF